MFCVPLTHDAFSQVNVGSAQWTLYGAVSFVPTTIKNHMVKIT